MGVHVPEPIVDPVDASNPEHEALLADSVGLALLVVLEMLSPAERLAFVLHDMFGVPFEQIAGIVQRSPDAARQMASRARRRVRGASPVSDVDLSAQREIVDAYLAASREGNFEGLVALLDPDVVVRADIGEAGWREVRGAREVAAQAFGFSRLGLTAVPAVVNGAAGWVTYRDGRPFSVGGITVRAGKITAIDILADPERLERIDFSVLER
jgi:RNA polymerase sigma-70 factor (ECF subfamily)